MTEQEWLTCSDPGRMLEFLRGQVSDLLGAGGQTAVGGVPLMDLLRGKVTDRKLRLFACACCRRIWHLLPNQEVRQAVELVERFADGQVGNTERSNARRSVQRSAQVRGVVRTPTLRKWQRRAASAVYYATARNAWEAACNASRLAVETLVWKAGGYSQGDVTYIERIQRSERPHQAALLRDIISNPRQQARIDPHCQTPTLVNLARLAYDERTFDLLPILADALEEAGCADMSILDHCRQGGDHVRGCWVVDLLLAR
jgi:hypothetical protein